MRFTGKNLELIQRALERAKSDVWMQVGQCPDVFEYADDLEMLEAESAEYEAMLNKINQAIRLT